MVDQVELVERVARAIFGAAQAEAVKHDAEAAIPTYDGDDEDAREFCRVMSRAAIAAMSRTPTTPERSDDE